MTSLSSAAKSVCLFALCFAFGLSVFFSVADRIPVMRDPASINSKVFQINNLSSDQIKNQLVQKIKVYPTIDGKKNIQFSGFSSALCRTYSEIEMEFQAEGVAVAGEIPSMKVTAPCEGGQDPAEMGNIQIPVAKILAEKPKNAEFSFNGYTAKIELKHAPDEWPTVWVLKAVQFKNASGQNKTATFDRKIASDSRPVVIEF